MSKEVLTPEVIEDLPLDEVINRTLVKNNVTEAVIKALKKQYGGMKLKGLDDKQGYLEIKEARNAVRKVGIITEKLCKAGRDDANKIRGMWIDKEKEVLAKIAEVQDPLDAEIKKFEDEKERLDQLEVQRKEEQFMKRQTTLLKMEAVYSGNSFALGGVSYELDNIKEADEEIWNDTILPKYQREFAKVEAERAEQERQKKEAEEKLRAEQEQLRIQQEELNKQREEMRKQQEALKQQQSEADRLAKEKRDAEINRRIEQLINLGLTYRPQDSCYTLSGEGQMVNIDVMTELKLWNDKEWNEGIDKITPIVESIKKGIEEKRLAKIEEEKQAAIELAKEQERKRIEEEQRQAEIKRQAEEQRKIEEAAKASDKEKWTVFVQMIQNVTFPEMKSSIYKNKINISRDKLAEIIEL